MFEFLDKLRKKTVHQRQQIAFIASTALFFLVATVWWQTFEFKREGTYALGDVLSPFAVIASAAKSSLVGGFGELKSTLTETTINTDINSTNIEIGVEGAGSNGTDMSNELLIATTSSYETEGQ